MESKLEVKIVRNVKAAVQPSTFFKGFDSVEVVQRIFGKKTRGTSIFESRV